MISKLNLKMSPLWWFLASVEVETTNFFVPEAEKKNVNLEPMFFIICDL